MGELLLARFFCLRFKLGVCLLKSKDLMEEVRLTSGEGMIPDGLHSSQQDIPSLLPLTSVHCHRDVQFLAL